MSLFRRKKSSAKLNNHSSPQPPSTPSYPTSPPRATSLSAAPPSSWDTPQTQLHVDDFGRTIPPQPAFATNGGGVPFGQGFGIGEDEIQGEAQLLYGYTPLFTTLELSVVQVEDVVAKCAASIRKSGLDTPLVLSSLALDISLEGVCSLIRTYVENPQEWARDLDLAAPLSVGAFMKWALARLISDRGGRGFVSWEVYSDFKTAERATGYPLKSCTVHLISRLAASNGRLLSALLSFFSSIAAHSGKNGMSPRRLAALFSPYVFGLPDDRNFDETYQQWQRATDAFEHILLSYIRDSKADGPLPTFLERFITGYPAILNISEVNNAPPKIPKGVRVEEVTRFKRLTRFHSRNLIQQSTTWNVQHSNNWQLLLDPTNSSSTPAYTPSYRHLLNIRSNHGLEDESGNYEDDSGEIQKYKSTIERDWGMFGESGFKEVDSKKLEFDLTEGERAQKPVNRETMDWSTFETSGFSGREMFAPTDLVFHQTIGQRVNTWPSSQKALTDKLRAAERALPPFPYETAPSEQGRVVVEKDFFEAWADVLVGGGWARDELKESSFALLHWKARSRDGELHRAGSDPRTEEKWVLVEEHVPREYREALMADPKSRPKASKRVSFMRAVRRRSGQKVPTTSEPPTRPSAPPGPSFTNFSPAPLSSSYGRKDSLRPIDEAIYHSDETQHLSLSNLHVDRASYAPSTSYAPSVVSTVRANDGHSNPAFSTTTLPRTDQWHRPPAIPPRTTNGGGVGIGGTLSSQTRESAFGGTGVPAAIGYVKPAPALTKKATFLSKIRSKGSSGNTSPIPTTAEEAIAASHAPAPPSPLPQSQARTAVSQVPLSPGRGQIGNGVAAPASPSGYHNGIMPGAPPLAPVAESPHVPQEATPPLPPKEWRTANTSESIINTDSSADDPYGGLEDETEGEVFRGSQSFPRDLNVQAGGAINGVRRLSVDQPVEPPRRVQNPNLASPIGQPLRSHSLQQSPQFDAELPIDEEPPHFPNERYKSGASQFSSRVANIARLCEERDRQQQQPEVRLTQYGFHEEGAPALGPPVHQ